MGLSALKQLKKEKNVVSDKTYVNTVIVGKSPFTVSLWEKLIHKKKPSDVLLVSNEKMTTFDLYPWGPSLVRGIDNITYFKECFSQVSISEQPVKSIFFKDQEFREFGGRSKPETLLFNETFFTQRAVQPNYAQLFPYILSEDFLSNLNERLCTEIITSVQKLSPTEELIGEKQWLISFASGKQIECGNLVWGLPVCDLFDVLVSTDIFDLDFIEFYSGSKSLSSLYWRFEIDGESPCKDTFFLPLSYTYEWGHFIGECKGNVVEFVHFMDRENITEDEIAKRIRIIKRAFEKIFPKNKINEATEYIYFAAESPLDKVTAKAIASGHHLYFVGMNAPSECLQENITHLTRALVSVDHVNLFLSGE